MKIAVGLSGGVDSSVVAALLKSQGHEVIGITMKIWDPELKLDIKAGAGNACYGPDENEDIEICEELAKQLDIPYYVFDLSKEYSKTIVEYFKTEYAAGRTPNPCVKCNSQMKFGFLLSSAKKSGLDFDYFATGHYARVIEINGRFYIKKATNLVKDQSYFIHRLDQDTLAHVMFPLGDKTKEEVRDLARRFGLAVAEKAESQDFIAGGDYTVLFDKKFLDGDIVDEDGKVLGRHNGIINYTVGQRKGINVGSATPLFVKEIDAKKNRIVVTSNEKLFTQYIHLTDMVFYGSISDSSLYVKIRQNHVPTKIEALERDGNLYLTESQRGITPGQAAVIYQDDIVIGYGTIGR